MTMTRFGTMAILCTSATLAVACGGSGGSGGVGESGEGSGRRPAIPADTAPTATVEQAETADTAVTLDDKDLEGAVVEDDRITFPAPTARIRDLQRGTTIVSTVDGKLMLREIDDEVTAPGPAGPSLLGKGRVFHTHPGTVGGLAKILHARKHVDIRPFDVDLSGKTLLHARGLNIKCRTCRLHYEPSFDFALDAEHGHASSFSTEFDGDLTNDWQVDVDTYDVVNLVAEVPLIKVPIVLVQTVGPVPIWETVIVSLNLGFGINTGPGAHVATGVHADKRVQAGVAYADQHWTTFHDHEAGLYVDRPDVDVSDQDIGLSIYLRPSLDVHLYSIAGPYIDVRAQANVETQICPRPSRYEASGTYAVDIGASLEFLGIRDRLIKKAIYQRDFPLGDGVFEAPSVRCREGERPERPERLDVADFAMPFPVIAAQGDVQSAPLTFQ